MEHPLPYRWRMESDNDLKRKTKLLNSMRVLKEIKKRFPEFQENNHKKMIEDPVRMKDKKVVTFAKLLHTIQEEDKVMNKCNTISLKQMELRKSRRIYAAGTSDDYILSKKNKNLNNLKLFEKISTAKKPEGPSLQDKQGFGPNQSLIEKIDIMFQLDQKERDKKAAVSKKFDEDAKKLHKFGP
eukprot:CAMPEP_0202959676 /NCGR_PEP_ID=MMETSP1396-20130829/3847_1 /ASSEMBLY_ACC=CAM_ASM_000872 /TAXON_ID= /ORGANISM="Pseudokeronopsis sp., Strain Brazil" /LENGTH=183 /DNA_ID=CAMNT_0049678361 /DNA_START=1842 /DNA_END=2393 /DNA_ORIENTATION=-